MNITLFGGAFNPPHLGHLIVIQQAFELIPEMDQLWILPDYKSTFLKDLTPAKHRLNMTKLLINEIDFSIKPKIKLETIALDRKLSGETYEALQLLKHTYPNHRFTFLMGSDQLISFEKWGNWEKLIKQLPFYIYPRSGYRNKIHLPNMTLLESPTQTITNLSSTLIRDRLKQNLKTSYLVPKSVLSYIQNHNLY